MSAADDDGTVPREMPKGDAVWLSGRVVGDDGAALGGVQVVVRPTWATAIAVEDGAIVPEYRCQSVVTGADGRFEFAEMVFREPDVVDDPELRDYWWDDEDEADWHADVEWRERPKRLLLCSEGRFDVRDEIDLIDGPVDLGDVRFRPSPTRSVRVVMPDGMPVSVARLTVVLRPPDAGPGREPLPRLCWELPLDESGLADVPLAGVTADMRLRWRVVHDECSDVAVNHDGDWLDRAGIESAAAVPARPLVLTASPDRSYTVRGRAVDSRGLPVPGLIVNIHTRKPFSVEALRHFTRHALTAEDGTFEIRGERLDRATLHLYEGYRVECPDGETFELPLPDGTPRAAVRLPKRSVRAGLIDVGDVEVAPSGDDGVPFERTEDRADDRTLRLRVVDRDGGPLPDAMISIHPDPTDPGVHARARPVGNRDLVVFHELPSRPCTVVVHAEIHGVRCTHVERGVEPGPPERTIRVTGAGTILVELVADNGATRFARMRVSTADRDRYGHTTGWSTLTFEHPPGRATFVVTAHGYEPTTLHDALILPDRPTRLRAEMRRLRGA